MAATEVTLCLVCQQPMEVLEPGFLYHPGCIPQFTPVPGIKGSMTPYDLEIREDVIEVIRWAAAHSRRSQQVTLGCSEVGHECDLRLAYKIAGMRPTGFSNDPWPAVVGTSIHSWMEQAIADYQAVHGVADWLTEMEVLPSPIVKGHTDLYDATRFLVLDWKFPSPDNLRKMRDEGPPQQYKIQVMLYGKGHVEAGRRVDRVGIVGLGRQGWLKDMYVWTTPYDPSVADEALARIYRIGQQLVDLDVLANPSTWSTINRSPSRLCTWCPYFRRNLSVVDETGCPGK